MRFSRAFLRTAALCAVGSALTTLGVHLLPRLYPDATTFEQQLLLPTYLPYRICQWVVLAHIVLVWVSMVGLGALRLDRAAGPVVIGLLGFHLFGISELLRTSFAMFAVNVWRTQFLSESSEAMKSVIRGNLHAWPEINSVLFFLLILGFLIGNLSYGIAFWRSASLEKVLSGALLIWALLSATTLLHEYMAQGWLGFIPEWLSWTYQPAVRLLAGAVLLRASSVETVTQAR